MVGIRTLFLLANLVVLPSEHSAYNICPTSSITIVIIEFGVDMMVVSKITEGTKAQSDRMRSRQNAGIITRVDSCLKRSIECR